MPRHPYSFSSVSPLLSCVFLPSVLPTVLPFAHHVLHSPNSLKIHRIEDRAMGGGLFLFCFAVQSPSQKPCLSPLQIRRIWGSPSTCAQTWLCPKSWAGWLASYVLQGTQTWVPAPRHGCGAPLPRAAPWKGRLCSSIGGGVGGLPVLCSSGHPDMGLELPSPDGVLPSGEGLGGEAGVGHSFLRRSAERLP